MPGREVQIAAVTRDLQAVRPFHLRRQFTDLDRLFHHRSVGAEAHAMDEIG
jgi:hypothetical protein